MNQTPDFPMVFRGFDPVEVQQHVAALQQAIQSARQEAAATTVELTKVQQDHAEATRTLAEHKSRIAELETAAKKVTTPSYTDLGERIGSMLGLADQEAQEIRERAHSEIASLRDETDKHVAGLRSEAELFSSETRSKAEAHASEMLAKARKEADSILDEAGREGAARREEAEAYFESQRAKAAAAAADFERTLGDRRDKATAEFNDQMAKQDAALAAVQERSTLLAREAEEEREARSKEAATIVEQARTQAGKLVKDAKDQAERIRRDSERELAASTARRDSITAQLSNVRNMLATISGSAPELAGFAAEAESDAAAEGEAHQPVADEVLEAPEAVADEAAQDAAPAEEPVAAEQVPAAAGGRKRG